MSKHEVIFTRAEATKVGKAGHDVINLYGQLQDVEPPTMIKSTVWMNDDTKIGRAKVALEKAGVTIGFDQDNNEMTFTFAGTRCEVEYSEKASSNGGEPYKTWEIPAVEVLRGQPAMALAAKLGAIGGRPVSATPVAKPVSSTPPPPTKKPTGPTRDSAWKAVSTHADANKLDASDAWSKLVTLTETEFGMTEDQFTSQQWSYVESQVIPVGM
jgi:hypothetical protein